MPLPFHAPSGMPHLARPYRVSKVTVIVEIVCQQCEAESPVTLINKQPARCPRCGANYDCGGLKWDATAQADAPPQVAISAGPPDRPKN